MLFSISSPKVKGFDISQNNIIATIKSARNEKYEYRQKRVFSTEGNPYDSAGITDGLGSQ